MSVWNENGHNLLVIGKLLKAIYPITSTQEFRGKDGFNMTPGLNCSGKGKCLHPQSLAQKLTHPFLYIVSHSDKYHFCFVGIGIAVHPYAGTCLSQAPGKKWNSRFCIWWKDNVEVSIISTFMWWQWNLEHCSLLVALHVYWMTCGCVRQNGLYRARTQLGRVLQKDGQLPSTTALPCEISSEECQPHQPLKNAAGKSMLSDGQCYLTFLIDLHQNEQ